MPINSKRKGKAGELAFASFLREHGFDARRGQQFSGTPDSPDIVSEDLKRWHWEIKRVQRLNLIDATVQAEGDCGGKPWIVAHKRNHAPWLVTMKAETLMDLLRLSLAVPGNNNAQKTAVPAPTPVLAGTHATDPETPPSGNASV